jgi:hypothetical protein
VSLAAAPARAESVVTIWDQAALDAVRDTKPGPPVVARAMAIVHTACFDAWAAYDDRAVGTRLGSYIRRPAAERTHANKRKAVSFAAYRALCDLFPQEAEVAYFTSVLRRLGYDPDETSLDPSTPAGMGNLAARALLDYRHGDGSNQLGDLHPGAYSDYTGYTPVNTPQQILDPNRWQPLEVDDGAGGVKTQQCIAPHWGNVVPFALKSSAELRPARGPARYPSHRYAEQARKALDYSAHLTDRQKVIVEYWADGPASELPPGHWCLLAQWVSQRHGYGLDQDVKLFFALANATMDAGIGCWETKRFYDSVRPITAVHFLYGDKKVTAWAGPYRGTQRIRGRDWSPYGQAATIRTPAFPEYTSGHSTYSAAAAEILRRFTGTDKFGYSITIGIGQSLTEPGVTPRKPITLRFQTYTDAAEQAGMSRIYGGIHFMDGNLDAQSMGRRIGNRVWQKALTYIRGTAQP